MPFTLIRFAEKLRDLQVSLGSTWQDVSAETGISAIRLQSLAAASEGPSGDEILILADYFRCEFTWLMEDDAKNPDENLRTMFRLEGDKLSVEDRHSINEFLFLCKCEALLEELLHIRREKERFSFPRQTGIYASQGEHCAAAIRDYYDIGPTGRRR
jgi:transcriptional regulator with XRE-family HTH domain